MIANRLFALASVTALAGVVVATSAAGCSSTSDSPVAPATEDAGKDVNAPPVDAGDEDAPPSKCPDPAFDAASLIQEQPVVFQAPKGVFTGDCSEADLARLAANLEDASIQSYEGLGAGLSAACVSCVITKSDEASWGPIVVLASDPTKGSFNYGACHAGLSGSVACGEAYQLDWGCATYACRECTESQESTCTEKVRAAGGTCEGIHRALLSKCPDLATTTKTCGDAIAQHAAVLCGASPDDAGPG